MTDGDFAKVYEKPSELGLIENEYVIVKDKGGEIIDKKRYDGKTLVPLKYKTIDNVHFSKIKPLNPEQEFLFDMLNNEKIIGKCVLGRFGVGKSFCSLVWALDKVVSQKSQYKNLIFIRNNINLSNTDSIGALPNGLVEKLLPFAMPIVDILGSKIELDRLISDEKLFIEHLGFLRGRNFSKSIVYLMEAGNITREQMALIVGRIGEESCLIVDGDVAQTDRAVFTKENGIVAMVEKFRGNSMFGVVTLTKNERSDFSTLSDLLLEK